MRAGPQAALALALALGLLLKSLQGLSREESKKQVSYFLKGFLYPPGIAGRGKMVYRGCFLAGESHLV